MKCLSVRQPWAWLICSGKKDVENRTWGTDHRGPILIHAGRTIEKEDIVWMKRTALDLPKHFTTGAIVGMAEVSRCTMKCASEWHNPGCIGWYLTDPVLFDTPIPWRGQLGLFDVPDDAVAEAIRKAREDAA